MKYILFLFLFCIYRTNAQDNILTAEEYLRIVKLYHPIAKVAENLGEQAAASALSARGNFDPKVSAEWQTKQFDGKSYYQIFSSGLKVPTWFGADIKAQFDLANGVLLDPQNYTPKAGLGTIGISLPLAQGLLIDERRAALQKAALLKKSNENERVLALNELLYEAAASYWEWAKADALTDIYRQSLVLAQTRFVGVKNSFLQGDRPAIDTLEALLICQDRQLQLESAILDGKNTLLRTMQYLWTPEGYPVEAEQGIEPSDITTLAVDPIADEEKNDILASLNEQNPLIKQYSFKLSDYNIDRKMKLEKLKPKINVEYNFLAKSFNYLNDYGYGLPLTNNYKWGVSFSMPLFLRQERADLKLTKLKIQNTEWQKDTKELELKNKIQMIVNKINTLTSQIQLSKDMLNNWNTLYKAETERFALGESSLFLINSRELKLLETNEKLLSLLSKYQEADLEFTYWKFRF